MGERSHREEMSAAIRAQRERRAVPRSVAPEPPAGAEPASAPAPPPKRRLFGRTRGA